MMCEKSGNYNKTAKWMVLLAIAGDDEGSRWVDIKQCNETGFLSLH